MNLVPSHPVLTCAEAKAWEKMLLTDDGAEWLAMRQAGRQLAFSIIADFREIGGLPPAARLLVLCGKGHNGGDALLAAHTILDASAAGFVDVLFCFGEEALRPLARRALETLQQKAGARLREITEDEMTGGSSAYDLCLDAVFGFQFRPPMDVATAGILAAANAHPRIRFRAAVDLPSGISDGGAASAFRADFTYATGIVKQPAVAEANGGFVGRLRYLDLGFFNGRMPEANERVLAETVLAPLAGLRSSQSDKRTYGHLCVMGGSHNYPGAVMLAVRAAMRSGVGLVTAFVPDSLAPAYAAAHPEAMWVGCPVNRAGGLSPECLALVRERMKRADALLVGPGLGDDPGTIGLIRQAVSGSEVPLILDADALRPEIIREIKAKPFVCTPHAGEFKRIKPALYSDNGFDASRGVLVLKGPLTRVSDGRVAYYSPFGGPVLARGGSGDMLAGLIAGLLAQAPDQPLLAACRGVVWHGLAADLLARTLGQVAVENSQLLEQLGPALIQNHARSIDRATGVHDPERSA